MRFQGVFSVLPTPFTRGGALDLESLRRVVELFVRAGVNGVTVLGVTGEVSRLSERERAIVLETTITQVDGRVPVIAGSSADGTLRCIEYCRHAVALKADAVMISPPRLVALSSAAVLNHYRALADALDVPIVIQDYPPLSGYAMEPILLTKIAREIPQARTIKLEDPPTPLKTAQILKESTDIEIDILGGLGGVYLLEELIAGASGVMTGFAYPEMLLDVVKCFRKDDLDRAADLFYTYVPLMRFEFQQGIGMAIRKEVLRLRGALSDATIRAPGGTLDSSALIALQHLLKWLREKRGAQWISQ